MEFQPKADIAGGVRREIDNAHPAASNLADDFVGADLLRCTVHF